MQQLAFSQTLNRRRIFCLSRWSNWQPWFLPQPAAFAAGEFSRRCSSGVALGLMLHAHVDAVPAAIAVPARSSAWCWSSLATAG